MTTIETLRPEDAQQAIACALARVPAAYRAERVQHCLDLLAAGAIDPRGVFVARTDGAMVSVQICVPLAGASCLFWLPATTDAHADALVSAALAWSRQQ